MKKCTINVKDEVNCKITGLDLNIRKKLVNLFKYEIPGARHMPAVRLGRWDGKIAMFQMGGSTYINLLPEIVPVLVSEGYDYELNDVRDYRIDYEFDCIDENSYSHIKWPEKHQLAEQPITLREHQVAVVNSFLSDTQSMQVAATGSGKTIVSAILSQKCEQYGRTIIIVPNKSLVIQTEEDYINLGLDVGVFFGDRKEFNKTHTICTWQSLNSLLKSTQSGSAEITITDFLQDVVCVMVDESHSIRAEKLKTLLTGVMSEIPIRWGFTGTIPKEDFARVTLRVCIGEVINEVNAKDLQDKGILANCHVNILQLRDYKDFTNYQSELKYLVSDSDRLDFIASEISKVASGNTLVLVDRIETGVYLETKIKNSVFLSGATKNKDRKEHYDEIADVDGKTIIATYGIAAVGLDLNRIFNLVLIEPGKSFVRVIQSIGRGLRVANDKDYVNIYDITSTCKFAKRHLTARKKFYKEVSYPFKINKVDWR